MGLDDMARRGKKKYEAKKDRMVTNYEAAVPRMKDHYADAGFGPIKTGNYKDAMDDAPDTYKDRMSEPIEDKWYDNWLAVMKM